MKIFGVILIFVSIPMFIGLLKAEPFLRKWAYFAVGILPFTINAINLDAALISWATWEGYSKGLILTLLDSLALAIVVVSRAPLRRLPLLWVVVGYLLAGTLSMANSLMPMSSSFFAFQLLRLLVIFVAVASFASRPVAVRWLACGLAAGAIFQAVTTLDQRSAGAIQAAGTMGHQNLLGFMLHCVTLPLFALMLAGERNKLIMLGVFAAMVTVALGASRGAVGFAGAGLAMLFALSLLRRSTAHKWRIVGFAALALAVVGPLSWSSFDRRFEAQAGGESGYDERAAFERAARMIWADYPMGVGGNNYVLVANTQGYSAAAGVVWTRSSRSAKVHNVYLLTAAETGWPGLIALVALLGWASLRGLTFAFRNRADRRGDVVLGATVAIMTMAVHSLYEWIFVTYQAEYVFAIMLGIVAGIIRQVELEKAQAEIAAVRSRAPPQGVSEPLPPPAREPVPA